MIYAKMSQPPPPHPRRLRIGSVRSTQKLCCIVRKYQILLLKGDFFITYTTIVAYIV